MVALERDKPRLKGVLPKDYSRPGFDIGLAALFGSELVTKVASTRGKPRCMGG